MPNVAFPGASGQVGLAPKTSDIAQGNLGAGRDTPPLMGAYNAYMGFTVRETGGTNPVTLRLWDNTAASGTLLEEIVVPAGGTVRASYEGIGVRLAKGIYFEKVSGTGVHEGVITYG